MADLFRMNLDFDPDARAIFDKILTEYFDSTIITQLDDVKKEKKPVSTKINWVGGQGLRFGDLTVGEHFVVDTDQSKGAVYRKVIVEHTVMNKVYQGTSFGQMEVATAKVFPPTQSQVKVVEVEISVKACKPNLAGY